MLDPEVAAAIGQLADEGITVFVPQGAEHMLRVEDGKLIIESEVLEVTDTIWCLICGYDGPEEGHVCNKPVVSCN